MTDATFERLREYVTERCPAVGRTYLARARIIVSPKVPTDDPMLVPPPAPPQIVVSQEDFHDLKQRLDQLEREEVRAWRR